MESYKHRFAKDVLAGWLDNWILSARTEYPVALDSGGKLHGLDGWGDPTPTYDALLARELLPIAIFDVAILFAHEIEGPGFGNLFSAYEIVHKSPLSQAKREYVARIGAELPSFRLRTIDPDWVLSRCGRPTKIEHIEDLRWINGVRQ